MKSPGRGAVALANKSCIAKVVFPAPGPPAIRLNESSGSPPPSTSFNPGIPVFSSASFAGLDAADFRAGFLAIAIFL
jgi:hypothetical protein